MIRGDFLAAMDNVAIGIENQDLRVFGEEDDGLVEGMGRFLGDSVDSGGAGCRRWGIGTTGVCYR